MGGFTAMTEFIIVDCSQCGMQFCITKDFHVRRTKDHATFLCPSGHSQYYGGESDVEKARREAEEARRNCEQKGKAIAKEYGYKIRYLKGVITKLKKK